jgi:hypothetical protein
MPDYQLSKVYQIVCLTTGEKYIGSTTQATLALRLGGHCRGYKQWKNGKAYLITSYPIIERGNYQIELLELYPCNSKDELNAREGHYIRTNDCVNKIIIGRTDKEWREVNKGKIAEKAKVYYAENKDEILEQKKTYRIDHTNERKKYYELNKTKLCEYNKTYQDINRDKIKEKQKTQYQPEKRKALYQAKKLQSDPHLV